MNAGLETRNSATPFYIPSLDGLRAVAFAIVFASHAISDRIPGGFGVTIFFFLSGYLITTLMRVEREKTGTVSLSRFYARRALRVLPNFYVVLIAAWLLAFSGLIPFVGEAWSSSGLWWQVFYGNNYYSIFRADYGTPLGTGVFWSLAVEEHFYLLFPVIYYGFAKLRLRPMSQACIFAILCAAILGWRFVIFSSFGGRSDEYTYKASDTRFDSMLFGCILAVVGNPALGEAGPRRRLWLLVGLPAGMVILLITFAVRDRWFRETIRYTLQGIALIPVFIVAIRYHRHVLFSWLNWRWIRFLGVLTYTLYLVHLIVLFAMHGVFAGMKHGGLLEALASAIICLFIALAMHYGVEVPLATYRKRLHAERKHDAAIITAG